MFTIYQSKTSLGQWIFRQIAAYLKDGTVLPKPDREALREMILRHAGLLLAHKGEYTGVREMRKHVSWYTAGLPNSARLRQSVNMAESFAELERILCMVWTSGA